MLWRRLRRRCCSHLRPGPWPTIRASVLADNPTAYWRLNEAAGSATAVNLGSTGSANDLTYNPTYTLGGVSPYGPLGTYVSFTNGGNAGNLNGQNLVQADNQSIEFWVKLTADRTVAGRIVSTADNLFAGGVASGVDVWAKGTVADGFHLGLTFVGFTNKDFTTVFPANTWTHVVVVEDNDTWKIYINGALDATTVVKQLKVPQTGFALGRNVRTALGSLWMIGDLDEAAWYDYVLTPGQISTHYNAGLGNLPAPTFDPVGEGVRVPPLSVTLNCGEPTATIAYTTDGSEPSSTNGTQVAPGTSIELTGNTTLKAIALETGYSPSDVTSSVYAFYPPIGENYENTVLADNPTAFWRLNETTGVTAVNQGSTGAANDLTYSGAYTLGAASPYAYFGDYASFTATGKASNGNGQNLVQANNQSVEFWVNLTADATGERLISTADHNNSLTQPSGFDVYATGTMADGFNIGIALTAFAAKVGVIPVQGNTWNHVVVVQSGGLFSMYINGVLDPTTWGPKALLTPQSGLALGYNVDAALGSKGMTGALDEVAWYDYAMTGDQVMKHYNTALGVLPAPTFSPEGGGDTHSADGRDHKLRHHGSDHRLHDGRQ